jgi:methionine-S-sulfoxide reductase
MTENQRNGEYNMKKIYLAGGCFWGVEKYFAMQKGVTSTETGYANGTSANPTYEEVCDGRAGFAEAVLIHYDETITNLSKLLEAFYVVVDPTSINKQGNDVGVQYRSGIYYTDISDVEVIEKSLASLEEKIGAKVAIEVLPLANYYTAEAYHQKYLVKNPSGYCHINFAALAGGRDDD